MNHGEIYLKTILYPFILNSPLENSHKFLQPHLSRLQAYFVQMFISVFTYWALVNGWTFPV